MTEKIAASLTLNNVEDMTDRQRKDIAFWLRMQAKTVLTKGDKLSRRYRARFFWWR